jgi:hypothetical protein
LLRGCIIGSRIQDALWHMALRFDRQKLGGLRRRATEADGDLPITAVSVARGADHFISGMKSIAAFATDMPASSNPSAWL